MTRLQPLPQLQQLHYLSLRASISARFVSTQWKMRRPVDCRMGRGVWARHQPHVQKRRSLCPVAIASTSVAVTSGWARTDVARAQFVVPLHMAMTVTLVDPNFGSPVLARSVGAPVRLPVLQPTMGEIPLRAPLLEM